MAASLGLWLLMSGCQLAVQRPYSYEYVRFDDIVPSYLTLTQSWNALGVDDQDRVYIIWTSKRDDGREDAALFRYARATGSRAFLGTFIDVATAQHNLLAGEEIPKGHTRILQIGRKLYMASQGFHDFKAEIAGLPKYRGAHLFTYDLDTGAFDDVSRTFPNGVLIEHQGIVALAYSPEHGLLVGLAHPLGDIVLFDVAQGTLRNVVSGIPWQLDHAVSREVVVTRKGKVYTYRGSEDSKWRELANEVWVYDLATGESKPTGQWLKGGFWNGQAETRDRNTIYLSTVSGELYVLDVEREIFSHAGHFIVGADFRSARQYRVRYLFGISLSAAEDAVLGVPIVAPTMGSELDATRSPLTSYSVAEHTFATQLDMDTEVFTGSNHRDSQGNLYMAAFDWNTNCKLAVLKPPLDPSGAASKSRAGQASRDPR